MAAVSDKVIMTALTLKSNVEAPEKKINATLKS